MEDLGRLSRAAAVARRAAGRILCPRVWGVAQVVWQPSGSQHASMASMAARGAVWALDLTKGTSRWACGAGLLTHTLQGT